VTGALRRDGFTGLLTLLALVVMVISLVTLLWLESRVRAAIASDIKRTVETFAQTPELGEPHRIEGVRFRRLDSLVDANRGAFIRRIWISKELADGSEHLLWPLTTWHTDPRWRDTVSSWERWDLRAGAGDVQGHLYFDLDPTWLGSIVWAARSVGVLIVIALALLLTRLWGTHRRLEATSDALLERQRELIHIERLALAGQLTANLLHDLKKPVLNIRHGISDLIHAMREFGGPRRALTELQAQTDLFQSILRETNLERFVQSRDEDQEYLDFNEVLRQSAGLVRYEQRDVELAYDLTEDLSAVHGSRHQLVQVFSNLILNAYQAMDGRGRLTLRSGAVPGGVRATVEDTGPGIAPEIRGRLFEPFVTTKATEEGTGLGLVICQMIIEEMRGAIQVLDRPNGGAAFSVTLPVGEGR
jgi:signal transduction histidine kinase